MQYNVVDQKEHEILTNYRFSFVTGFVFNPIPAWISRLVFEGKSLPVLCYLGANLKHL